MADKAAIQHLIIDERARLLDAQITGNTLSLAALLGMSDNSVGDLAIQRAESLKEQLGKKNKRLLDRLSAAREKYLLRQIEGQT